jgi:outer membrane protein assembly factor BamB
MTNRKAAVAALNLRAGFGRLSDMGRDRWRRAAVAAVVAAAAVAGVAVVRRDLPDPAGRPAPTGTAAAGTTGTGPRDRPASVPERPWPTRSPGWTARGAADRLDGPPGVHGAVAVGGMVLTVGGDPGHGRLAAYDARTGAPRWRSRAGEAATVWAASPRAVVVGSDQGELAALDPGTGRRRWRLRLAPGQGPDAATLSGDHLVVETSFPGEGDLRPPVLLALDARTGRRRWRAVLRRGTDLQWAPPVRVEGLVLVASTPSDPRIAAGDALHALDAATGRPRWEVPLPSRGPSFHGEQPLVHRGLVIVPAAGALVAVDPGSGREVWRRPTPSPPRLVGATGGLVLAVAGDGLVALSAADGRERWRLALADRHRWVALGAGRVYALAAGLAMAVDPATGRVLWGTLTGAAVGPPLAVGGRLYVPTTRGLEAKEASTGQIAWFGDWRQLTGGAVAAGGRVVVATRDGDLLGYDP